MRAPRVGDLIRYAYLWADEAERGRKSGVKDRPCAVVASTSGEADGLTLMVLPVTHSAPVGQSTGIEIPPFTKRRLSLDDARSWIVVGEYNRFVWPGPDIRPGPGGEAIIGLLPDALINLAISGLRRNALAGRVRGAVRKDD